MTLKTAIEQQWIVFTLALLSFQFRCFAPKYCEEDMNVAMRNAIGYLNVDSRPLDLILFVEPTRNMVTVEYQYGGRTTNREAATS